MKACVAALGAVLAVLLGTGAGGTAFATARECRDVRVAVPVRADGPATERIAGRLCRPPGAPSRVVQLLVHGLSYDRAYWDPHVAAMRRARIATLAIDRLGAGRSSRPPGERVDLALHVASLARVARWLRRDAPGGPFRRVVLVGHSLGTVVARGVAVSSPDVAGLVATGFTHRLTTGPVLARLVACTQAGGGGYFTMRPGCRAGVFFAAPAAAPGALAADRRQPARGAAAELPAVPGSSNDADGLSARVRVPVLQAAGSRDALFCDDGRCASRAALRAAERPFWRGARSFDAFVVGRAGHNVQHHRGAGALARAAAAFARAR